MWPIFASKFLAAILTSYQIKDQWYCGGNDLVLILSSSLFVLLKGATKEQAFDIGKDIVDTVTAMNPKPVKLKFEKVSFRNLQR